MTWHLKPHPHHHPNRLGAMLNHPASGLFYCQTQKTCEKKQLHITMKFHSSLPSNPTTQPPLPPPPKKKKKEKTLLKKQCKLLKCCDSAVTIAITTFYFSQLYCPNGISLMGNLGCLPWGKPAATELPYPTYGACWVF